MSMDMMGTERVCYVHCNFCNTTLAVSVPCSSMLTVVTVRCGHCANLLSVNMGASLQTLPPQDPQHFQEPSRKELGSSSRCKAFEPLLRRDNVFLPLIIGSLRRKYKESKPVTQISATGKHLAQQPKTGHIFLTFTLG